jgi:hypothetical protein
MVPWWFCEPIAQNVGCFCCPFFVKINSPFFCEREAQNFGLLL